jgi:hypothetical protein
MAAAGPFKGILAGPMLEIASSGVRSYILISVGNTNGEPLIVKPGEYGSTSGACNHCVATAKS